MNISRLLNKDFWALLISIICSLILFFNSNSESVRRVHSDVVDGVAAITYPQRWYQNIFLIESENKALADSLLHYRMSYYDILLELEDNSDSSGTFKQMLHTGQLMSQNLCTTVVIENLKDSQPLTLIPARVTNRNFASIETIIANVGKNDNSLLKENLTVLDISGGLLGKTIAVGDNAAKVQLITDNNFSVSVRVGSGTKSSLGNFIPTVGKYGLLEGVLKSTDLKMGDLAYTSGISDIYPSDIPVARVISASKDNNKPFQDVKVEILSNFYNLNYIFIVL